MDHLSSTAIVVVKTLALVKKTRSDMQSSIAVHRQLKTRTRLKDFLAPLHVYPCRMYLEAANTDIMVFQPGHYARIFSG
jgi:hypothetical protein